MNKKRYISRRYDLEEGFISFAIKYVKGNYFYIDLLKERYVWYNIDYYNYYGDL